MEAFGNLKTEILQGIYSLDKDAPSKEKVFKERVYFYDEWCDSNTKRGCVSIYFKIYDKKEEIEKTNIVTYHIRITNNEVSCYKNAKITQEPEVKFKINSNKNEKIKNNNSREPAYN